ncbi:hypothetical protein [Mycoplasma sp. 46852]|uniref:hypothetical protein n=1 Tax=Mycoplasma sp. 46852 TaxID=3401683 RepID=UPI003AAC1F33
MKNVTISKKHVSTTTKRELVMRSQEYDTVSTNTVIKDKMIPNKKPITKGI